jgi:hypothetical protein
MSSISSSDRSRQDDRVRQTREEYESREAENTKKKNREVSRLQKRHNEEVSQITEDYEDRIAQMKEGHRATLNERDQSNNRKIEDIRNLYRGSLKSRMEDSESERQALRSNYEGELKKQKQISESQKQNLVSQMTEEVGSRDQKFATQVEESRQKAQDSVKTNARRLNEAHAKERDALIESHSKTLEDKNRATNEMRKSYQGQLKTSEQRRQGDNERWSQKFTDTLKNKDAEYSDNLQMKGMILEGERTHLRDKYETALNDKSDAMDSQNQEFRETVNERVNSQIRSRDGKIQTLSGKLNNEISKNDRLRALERKNLTQDYEKRLNLAEDMREDAVSRMKELNGERISKVLDSSEKMLRQSERDSTFQRNTLTSQYRADKENLKMQHKDQLDQVTNTAENRVKKIVDLANKNQDVTAKYYDDALEQTKANYMNRVESQRDREINTQVTSNKVMTERFRNLEKTLNNRNEATVQNYETKIAQLKENHAQEMKRLEAQYAERSKNAVKSGKVEKDSLEMKYEAKLAQMNESHQDQLDRMNRRHQEDMQNLAVKVSSYNRKA